ncbi:unnamed protein product [Caenorhabditis angaria]|uniref:Uncharacterized protein n=1 Tax=Caenorhabditis angaria TaxID=860376 RepID=A0A9P1N494_9PELO|nr:unnamed protein product [Caenorhabditis angaria]
MLFTSSLRKAVDMYPPVSSEEAHRQLLEKRRKQMIRRHTCSTLIKQEVVQPKNSQCLGILEETNETEICQTSRSKHHTLEMPMAPPAPPPSSFLPPPQSNHSSRLDDWGESNFAPPPAAPILQGASGGNQTAYSSGQNNDDFDDEWTDEDEEQNGRFEQILEEFGTIQKKMTRNHTEFRT